MYQRWTRITPLWEQNKSPDANNFLARTEDFFQNTASGSLLRGNICSDLTVYASTFDDFYAKQVPASFQGLKLLCNKGCSLVKVT